MLIINYRSAQPRIACTQSLRKIPKAPARSAAVGLKTGRISGTINRCIK
jgi:hypothetical protein